MNTFHRATTTLQKVSRAESDDDYENNEDDEDEDDDGTAAAIDGSLILFALYLPFLQHAVLYYTILYLSPGKGRCSLPLAYKQICLHHDSPASIPSQPPIMEYHTEKPPVNSLEPLPAPSPSVSPSYSLGSTLVMNLANSASGNRPLRSPWPFLLFYRPQQTLLLCSSYRNSSTLYTPTSHRPADRCCWNI